jgi:hypothetical protein
LNSPGGVIAAFGYLWVQDEPGDSLWKISPSGQVVAKFSSVSKNPKPFYAGMGGGGLQTLGAGFGSIWTLVRGSVLRLDPSSGHVVASIAVAKTSQSLALGLGSVWIINNSGGILRIDPDTNTTKSVVSSGTSPAAFAAGLGALWVNEISESSRISKFDPATGTMVSDLQQPMRAFVTIAGNRLWVTDRAGGVLSIDPMTEAVSKARDVGHGIMGVTASARVLWVNAGDLVAIDLSTGRVVLVVRIAKPTYATAGIAVLGHRVWLAEPGLQQLVGVEVSDLS